jgi:hypothetical protein
MIRIPFWPAHGKAWRAIWANPQQASSVPPVSRGIPPVRVFFVLRGWARHNGASYSTGADRQGSANACAQLGGRKPLPQEPLRAAPPCAASEKHNRVRGSPPTPPRAGAMNARRASGSSWREHCRIRTISPTPHSRAPLAANECASAVAGRQGRVDALAPRRFGEAVESASMLLHLGNARRHAGRSPSKRKNPQVLANPGVKTRTFDEGKEVR